MKIYITGLPSGYEVEHLVRLFYPMHRSPSPRRRTPRLRLGRKTPDGLQYTGASGRQKC